MKHVNKKSFLPPPNDGRDPSLSELILIQKFEFSVSRLGFSYSGKVGCTRTIIWIFGIKEIDTRFFAVRKLSIFSYPKV